MGKLIQYFGSQINKLSDTELHVFHFIDNQLHNIEDLSLTSMSQLVNVSNSSIIRMCQKLNMEGFSELKYLIKKLNLEAKNQTLYNVKSYDILIKDTLDNLNHDDIEYFSEAIFKSKKVFIFGIGLSQITAKYFSQLLTKLKKPSLYLCDTIDETYHLAEENDLVIIISSGGYTDEINNLANSLKSRNIKIFSLTNSANNRLNKIVSFSLSSNIPDRKYEHRDITSRSGIMIIIDMIIDSYLIKINKKNII